MPYGNESQLNFSVEETVWFRTGQEIEQLISISLEPEIAIEETEQYVFIRGALHLSGEYNKVVDGELPELDYVVPMFIHSVLERDDSSCRFSHRFPIDITIPLKRINDLDDVEVSISTFDYELTANRCLKLTADLQISGLQQRTVTGQNDDNNVPNMTAGMTVPPEFIGPTHIVEQDDRPASEQTMTADFSGTASENYDDSTGFTGTASEDSSTPADFAGVASEDYEPRTDFTLPSSKSDTGQTDFTSPIDESVSDSMEGISPDRSEEAELISNTTDDFTGLDDEAFIADENFSDSAEAGYFYEIPEEDRQPFTVEARQTKDGISENAEMQIPSLNVTQQVVSSSKLEQLQKADLTKSASLEEVSMKNRDVLKSSFVDQEVEQLKGVEVSQSNDEQSYENQLLEPKLTVRAEQEIKTGENEGDFEGEHSDNITEVDIELGMEIEAEIETESEETSSKGKKKKTFKEKLTKSETMTLTEFFSRGEEDSQAQLRLCIVQADETISVLASKYRVSEQKILHINKLDLTDEIYEGQVLYIPIVEQEH